MNLFWDSSAVLALVLDEPRSPDARAAWDQSDADYAWRWLAAETSAGLARRRANNSQWKALDEILGAFHFSDPESNAVDAIRQANRRWALRAADAGHLHCFQQVSFVLPEIELVCFDDEIITAAKGLGLRVWTAGANNVPPRRVREARAEYGRVRKRSRRSR
jgi:hypothetical protein